MKRFEQTILCIDDNKDTCELIEYMFKLRNYAVDSCLMPDQGLEKAESGVYSAIILDNWFVETTGIYICEKIRLSDSVTPIIFFSAEARPVEKQKAINAGANEYLIKPDDLERLTETVIDLIQKQ